MDSTNLRDTFKALKKDVADEIALLQQQLKAKSEQIDRSLQQLEDVQKETANLEEEKQRLRDLPLPGGCHWQGNIVLHDKTRQEMAYIPMGEFRMGTEEWCDTQPVRTIYLDPYCIGRYPVTNAQFAAFIDDGGYKNEDYWDEDGWEWRSVEQWECPRSDLWGQAPWNVLNHPVIGVSWYEARAYCKWAGLCLPTEAQWLKAARGGIWLDGDNSKQRQNPLPQRRYPWGNEAPDQDKIWRANYCETPEYGNKSTSPVGVFSAGASPYGCLDMAGNVWEWCKDCYDRNYYADMPCQNPHGPATGDYRVVLGASWRSVARRLAFYRDWDAPRFRVGRGGFRAAFFLSPS